MRQQYYSQGGVMHSSTSEWCELVSHPAVTALKDFLNVSLCVSLGRDLEMSPGIIPKCIDMPLFSCCNIHTLVTRQR